MSFPEFVKAISEIPDIDSDVHFRSQIDFITYKNGEIITDFIGRFENLNQDFNYVCKKLKINDVHLEHLNKSIRKKNYRRYYNDELANLVYKRYKKDIRLFNYEF